MEKKEIDVYGEELLGDVTRVVSQDTSILIYSRLYIILGNDDLLSEMIPNIIDIDYNDEYQDIHYSRLIKTLHDNIINLLLINSDVTKTLIKRGDFWLMCIKKLLRYLLYQDTNRMSNNGIKLKLKYPYLDNFDIYECIGILSYNQDMIIKILYRNIIAHTKHDIDDVYKFKRNFKHDFKNLFGPTIHNHWLRKDDIIQPFFTGTNAKFHFNDNILSYMVSFSIISYKKKVYNVCKDISKDKDALKLFERDLLVDLKKRIEFCLDDILSTKEKNEYVPIKDIPFEYKFFWLLYRTRVKQEGNTYNNPIRKVLHSKNDNQDNIGLCQSCNNKTSIIDKTLSIERGEFMFFCNTECRLNIK